MPSLDELLRQRALVAEHLAWLDAQISSADGNSDAAAPAPVPPLPASSSAPAPVALDETAEQLISQYHEESKNSPQRVRTGCFIVFALALIVVVGGTAAVYVLHYR